MGRARALAIWEIILFWFYIAVDYELCINRFKGILSCSYLKIFFEYYGRMLRGYNS